MSIGLTQVDATIEEVVSTQVQDVLTASAVMPGTILDFSSEAGPGMDTVKYPRFANFTVQTKTSGSPLTNQVNTFATDDLALDQHKAVPFLVEDIAGLQAKVSVNQELINQAGKDLAAEMDSSIITQMVLSANISSAAPDHIVQFDNNPTDTLGKADVLTARRLLNDANVPMSDRTLLVSPLHESELMNISEFTRVDESGGSQALRNGQIGRLFGFDVIMSSQAPDTDGPIFYHRTAAVMARQMELRTEQDRSLLDVGTQWLLQHNYGRLAGLDGGKRIVKVNDTGA